MNELPSVRDVDEQVRLLAARVSAIEKRNRDVEVKKAWETCLTRKVCILLLTYLVMMLVFYWLGNSDYVLNAVVPTLGFFLSTLSLPMLRRIWMKQAGKKFSGRGDIYDDVQSI